VKAVDATPSSGQSVAARRSHAKAPANWLTSTTCAAAGMLHGPGWSPLMAASMHGRFCRHQPDRVSMTSRFADIAGEWVGRDQARRFWRRAWSRNVGECRQGGASSSSDGNRRRSCRTSKDIKDRAPRQSIDAAVYRQRRRDAADCRGRQADAQRTYVLARIRCTIDRPSPARGGGVQDAIVRGGRPPNPQFLARPISRSCCTARGRGRGNTKFLDVLISRMEAAVMIWLAMVVSFRKV